MVQPGRGLFFLLLCTLFRVQLGRGLFFLIFALFL